MLKKILWLIICFWGLMTNVQVVFGESKDYQDIINLYIETNKESREAQLKVDNKIYLYEQYKSNADYYKGLMEKTTNEEIKKSYTENYEEELCKAKSYAYYFENRDKCIQQERHSEYYKVLMNYLSIPVYEAEINYYQSKVEEYRERYRVLKKQKKKGLVKKSEVSEIRLALEDFINARKEAEETVEMRKKQISSQIPKCQFNYNIKTCTLKNNNYYQSLLKSSVKYSVLDEEWKAYSLYYNNIQQNLPEEKDLLKSISLNLGQKELEKVQLQESFNTFYSEKINLFRSSNRKVKSYNKKLAFYSKKLKRMKKLQKKKLVNRHQVLEVESKEKELACNVVKEMYQMWSVYYQLEYQLQ